MRFPALALASLGRLAAFMLAVTLLLGGCDKGPSGTYEAKAPGDQGTMTLEFQKDNKVKMIAQGPMGKVEFTCDYTVEGDKVTIKPPNELGGAGDTLVLVKKGSNYEATEGSETLTFVKK